MSTTNRAREYPIVYDDAFRSLFTFTPIPLVLGISTWSFLGESGTAGTAWFFVVCASATMLGSLGYTIWTHLLFSRTPLTQAAHIAVAQQRRKISRMQRILGMGNTDSGSLALAVAAITLLFAIIALILGMREAGGARVLIVFISLAVSWVTMVEAFALHYFRLHSAGERITFDLKEEPRYTDSVSMSVMISSVGALSAGTPRTRSSLRAVRNHTAIAFAFNTIVVAIAVSTLSALVTGMAA